MQPSHHYNPDEKDLERLAQVIEQADPLLGTIMGNHFKIISKLGTGGMSTVYRARHMLMERDVAIKLIHKEAVNRNSLKRFQKEASATGRFSHPNAIELIDFGINETGQPYIVLELCQGKNLAQFIEERQLENWQRGVDIILPICNALATAHASGIIHRDLKPSNIMISAEQNKLGVKVLDFGIARMIGAEDAERSQLTQTGDVIGSPQYMSPEQCQGIRVDHRSDIYSLGCVMYELFTGSKAAGGDNTFAVMNNHLSVTPQSFKDAGCSLAPAKLEEIIFKCLEKRPENRYQSMIELEQDLIALKSQKNDRLGASQTMRWLLRASKRKKHLPLKIISFCLLAVSATAIFYFCSLASYEQLAKQEFAAGMKEAEKHHPRVAAEHFLKACSAASRSEATKSLHMDSLKQLAASYSQLGEWPNMDKTLKELAAVRKTVQMDRSHFSEGEIDDLYRTLRNFAPTQVTADHPASYYVDWIDKLDDGALMLLTNNRPEEARNLNVLSSNLQLEMKFSRPQAKVDYLTKTALHHAANQNFKEAETYFSKAYEMAKSADHLPPRKMIMAESNLARVYTMKGQLQKAENLLQQALATGARFPNTTKHETVDAMMDLAALRRRQGKDEEAIKLEEDAEKLRKTIRRKSKK